MADETIPDLPRLNSAVRPLPLEALPREGRAPLDTEAGRVAWEEYEAVAAQLPRRDAVLLACLAYQRHQDARRLAHSYPLSSGVHIARQHPGAVRAALEMLEFWGGSDGPRAEEAMARALAAAEGWWERHLAAERMHERRHGAQARQIAADLEQARSRARVHTVTISGRQR